MQRVTFRGVTMLLDTRLQATIHKPTVRPFRVSLMAAESTVLTGIDSFAKPEINFLDRT
jgi:hypothetical protein